MNIVAIHSVVTFACAQKTYHIDTRSITSIVVAAINNGFVQEK